MNSVEVLSLEEAWQWVNEQFPFRDYIPAARRESYFEMPKAVSKWLANGASILDFGAGPCDKTAMLSLIGYEITAFDDLGDEWHNFCDNRKKILDYAARAGIKYVLPDDNGGFIFPPQQFDAIVLNNVIEHLHDSPRKLLNKLLESLKTNGFIFIDVPNAVNLRKRLDILRGRTNYPHFESFYWSSYPWRGHIREYCRGDLVRLGKFLGLEILEISTHHYHLDKVGPVARDLFKTICRMFPGFRESWLFVGRKPEGWRARNEPSDEEVAVAFRKQYFKYDKSKIDWEK